MNPALKQFMEMAALALAILGLIFGLAFTVVTGEANKYKTKVTEIQPPTVQTTPTTTP